MDIFHALKIGDHQSLQQLINSVNVDLRDHSAKASSPLHWSAALGNYAATILLLQRGFDINAKEVDGKTPLHCAAFSGHEDVVKLLLMKRADYEIRDKNGHMPVDLAIFNRHTKVAKLFCNYPQRNKWLANRDGTQMIDQEIRGSSLSPTKPKSSHVEPLNYDKLREIETALKNSQNVHSPILQERYPRRTRNDDRWSQWVNDETLVQDANDMSHGLRPHERVESCVAPSPQQQRFSNISSGTFRQTDSTTVLGGGTHDETTDGQVKYVRDLIGRVSSDSRHYDNIFQERSEKKKKEATSFAKLHLGGHQASDAGDDHQIKCPVCGFMCEGEDLSTHVLVCISAKQRVAATVFPRHYANSVVTALQNEGCWVEPPPPLSPSAMTPRRRQKMM